MIEPAQNIVAAGTKLILPFSEGNVTPQGYDVTVGKIEEMNGMGELLRTGKRLPSYEPAHFRDGIFHLRKGVYLLTFQEELHIPNHQAGLLWPRSSLLRMGATLHTAVWDAGYYGQGASVLEVLNPMGVKIEQGVAIGQMLFCELWEPSDRPYNGQYQGGKNT